jgi:putative transposase
VRDSILEGLDEILTVNRLGLPAELRRSLAFKNWVDGVLGAMGCQGGLQDRQLAMGFETTKAFCRLHHGGSRPAQGHRGIAPVLHVAADAPDRAVHVLDDVGASQSAAA